MINNANIDVLLMRFIHVVMEKRKTIKFRFVGSNKIKQVDYVDSTADVKVTDFNGWSSENEKLKHFQPKVNRTLVNLTEKNEPEEKKTRPRSTKSKSKDKRDIRVVYDHDVRQQQHKNPFMNELIQILNRHEPSTISNYRSAVTQKLISIFNLENDYNKQVSKRTSLQVINLLDVFGILVTESTTNTDCSYANPSSHRSPIRRDEIFS